MATMTPLYSYMFKAFYDWLVDNDANPRLIVDASQPNVNVPREYVSEDRIVLSIHPRFITDLSIGKTTLSFYTKFRGVRKFVVIPYYAMNEIVFNDDYSSIPIGVWMTSLDMALHAANPLDEPEVYMSTGPMPGDRGSDAGAGSDAGSVSFAEVDSMMPGTGDSGSADAAEDWKRRLRDKGEDKGKKPSFSIL